ncbi:hypothetical protein IWZ00DRAFT_572609 [Phyllosticta capitalensis]
MAAHGDIRQEMMAVGPWPMPLQPTFINLSTSPHARAQTHKMFLTYTVSELELYNHEEFVPKLAHVVEIICKAQGNKNMSRDCLYLVTGSVTYYTLRPLIWCHAIGSTALSTARAIYIMSRKDDSPPPSKPSAHELAIEAEAARYEKILSEHLLKLAITTPDTSARHLSREVSRPVSREMGLEIPSEKARKSRSIITVAEVPCYSNPARQKHHSFLPRIRIDIHLDVYPAACE